MILTKSKIYETRLFDSDLLDKNFRLVYRRNTGFRSKDGLGYACGINHKKLIGIYILRLPRRGNNVWNWGMAYSRDERLVDFFISKGADDWNWGLSYVAREGNDKLVHFYVAKGGRDYWGTGTRWAKEHGHKRLFHFLEKIRDKTRSYNFF